uniref:PID domain-containing protein n=1 Tax=Strigamia maritima TaxID=126957 RepID=T1J2M4_STRMM
MSTPICRCRVLYLGSAVPHITKDGLQGIQEPLRELYPDEGILGARGIDSWLSVWSNGLLLENIDELGKRLTRFFPVETLHYCAAVRHVVVPGSDGERVQRFLPLDSPFARVPSATNPPLFACILRRTTGIKVLECHAFICKKEMAANALVRCCFHAYADNMYARQLETQGNGNSNGNGTMNSNGNWHANHRADSPTRQNGQQNGENGDLISIYDENHKVWGGSASSSSPSPEVKPLYSDTGTNTTIQSIKSTNSQKIPRLRQMILPSKPPPPVEILPSNEKSSKKEAKHNKKGSDSLYSILSDRSLAPTNGHGPPRGTPPGPHLIPHPEARRYRGGGGGTPVYGFPPQPPPLVGTNGRPLPPYILMKSAEEPTYMPSTRPLSPTASYQPAAFPYDRYYMHQYNGTIQAQQQKQSKKKRKNEKNSDSESKYSTGIYRKKGHLNERAFSYSIRQEHRSRSHSSLSAIAFNGNNSTPKHSSDKELAQMVTEISLTEDGSDEGDRRHQIHKSKTKKVGR